MFKLLFPKTGLILIFFSASTPKAGYSVYNLPEKGNPNGTNKPRPDIPAIPNMASAEPSRAQEKPFRPGPSQPGTIPLPGRSTPHLSSHLERNNPIVPPLGISTTRLATQLFSPLGTCGVTGIDWNPPPPGSMCRFKMLFIGSLPIRLYLHHQHLCPAKQYPQPGIGVMK